MPNYNYIRKLGINKRHCWWFQQEPPGWEGHSGKDSCQQQVGQGQCKKSRHRKKLSIMSISSHSLQSIEVGCVQGHKNILGLDILSHFIFIFTWNYCNSSLYITPVWSFFILNTWWM